MATDKAIGRLKKLSLFFDKIAVVDMHDTILCHYNRWEPTRLLIKEGILFDPNYPHYNASRKLAEKHSDLNELWHLYESTLKESKSILDFSRIITGPGKKEGSYRASKLYVEAQEFLARCISASINKDNNAVPILPCFGSISDLTSIRKGDVVNLALNSLPLPSPGTSWEQIFEFRNDPDIKSDLIGLRTWISDSSLTKLSVNEIEDKLEWQIIQYKKHLKLHNLKTNIGAIESVLTIGAEVVENLAKLKLSKAVKAVFSWKHRKIRLLQAELEVPYPELAFIVKARKRFS